MEELVIKLLIALEHHIHIINENIDYLDSEVKGLSFIKDTQSKINLLQRVTSDLRKQYIGTKLQRDREMSLICQSMVEKEQELNVRLLKEMQKCNEEIQRLRDLNQSLINNNNSELKVVKDL